jgi:hypothetical protein
LTQVHITENRKLGLVDSVSQCRAWLCNHITHGGAHISTVEEVVGSSSATGTRMRVLCQEEREMSKES